MDLSFFSTPKKKILMGAVVAIFVLLISLLLLNGKKTPQPISQQNLAFPTGISQRCEGRPTGGITDRLMPTPFKQSSQTSLPPTQIFASYENKTNLPALPQIINQYTFKTKFSEEEVRLLATKLGLTESKTSGENHIIFYSSPNSQTQGILSFNLSSGEYTYENYSPQSSTATAPPIIIASNFLKSAGLIDDTVTCPITYQKRGIDDTTFVECHRDWRKIGAPILSFVGSLNVAEDMPLTQLSIGKTDKTTPVDSSIINVSTGENARARPNDFNTITVAVSSQGNVIFIQSNLRTIEKITPLKPKNILTPQQALNQFMNNQANLSFSSLRGEGVVNLAKVYPQNQAKAKKAFITDYLLTYLEKPPGEQQEKLSPTYLIRGLAELESGYSIQFVKTLPAIKESYLSAVLGAASLYTAVPFPTYPAGKANPLGLDRPESESWRCLKAESYQGETQPGGKTENRLRLSAEGLTPSTKLYFIGCVSKANGTIKCTTGDMLTDLQLQLINNMSEKDSNFEFIVAGENPINLASTKAEKIVYSNSADYHDVQSFYGLMVLPPKLLSQGKGDSLQYGSFKFRQDTSKCTAIRWTEPTPTPTPPPTQPPRTQPPLITSSPRSCCVPSASDLNPIYEVEGVKFGKNTTYSREWYYIPPSGATEQIVTADIEKIRQNFQSVTGKTNQFRDLKNILSEFRAIKRNTQCPDCPVRTTGSSPSLFVYGQKDTILSIEPKMALTYSDPSVFEAKMWSIVIKNDDILRVNNLNREYIYYEYQPVKFDRPKNGWLVEKSQLEKLAAAVGAKLGLNTKEKQRLTIELKLAASDVSDELLFIGLIPQKEIEQKLPLTITPKPEAVYRYHFFITSARQNEKPHQPKLFPITRSKFLVVELGATTK